MKIVSTLFLGLILLVLLVWSIGFFVLNDFSVPTTNIAAYKKIFIIFPHADDETLTASGLMKLANTQGKQVTWIILTKGEKGNPTDTYDPKLKAIRVSEVQKVASMLGVSEVIQKDFGDGQVKQKKKEVTEFLTTVFQKEKPDLVITYDLSGWYGHPDHIATTEVVNAVIKTIAPKTHLWYVTLPKQVWSLAGGLPTRMAENPDWITHRTFPNAKVFVGFHVIDTILSLYTYKSQYQAFRDSIPFAPIPMWFLISMEWFEYFHVVQ